MRYKKQLCLFLVVCASSVAWCAVQNGAPEARHAYIPDTLYVYEYRSVGSVYQDVEFSLRSKVLLGLVHTSLTQTELFIEFHDTGFNLTTPTSQPAHSFGDLSHWFSFILDENGRIPEVFYPSGELAEILAFKKTVVKMLNLGDVERTMEGSKVILTENILTNGLKGTKTLTFAETGLLTSAEINERVSHDHLPDTPLMGYPIRSSSSLSFIQEEEVSTSRNRPNGLVSDSIEIKSIMSRVPLSQLEDALTASLHECIGSAQDTCLESLTALFQKLSPSDIKTFLTSFFMSDVDTASRDFSEKALILVNTLSQLEASRATSELSGTLTEHLLLSSDIDKSVVVSLLKHLTRGRFLPDRATVDAVYDLVLSGDSQLTRPALLALGGMSRLLQAPNAEMADEIVDTLRSMLDQFSGGGGEEGTSSRLRRSVSMETPYDPVTHATIIDSIGNAHSERSLQILSDHATRSHDNEGGSHDLTLRHAAVNAIRGLKSEESADILLQITDSTPHPSVRHLAASVYQAHPRRTRDLSHVTQESHPHRSRRQVADSVDHATNVTIPTVTWSRQFGETNISVDVARTLRNSFDIETAPLSSHYTFSLHDEASFTTNLLLSDGQQRSEMLKTQVCLQGTAAYDANILTNVDHNLTAHQFDRLSSAVPSIEFLFEDAYARIAGTPSLYTGLDDLVQSSLSNLPSRFSLVDDALASFRRVVDRIDGEFVLKTRAEELFSSVNQTFSERRGLANDSVQPISAAVTSLLPSRPESFSDSLLIQSQPFTESTFYVPYLRYAPQQALSNINQVLRGAESAFSSLEASALNLLNLTGEFGANQAWLGPTPRSHETELAILLPELGVAVDTATKCEEEVYDGATLSELQSLNTAVSTHLYQALSLLGDVGAELTDASAQMNSAYQESRIGLVSLQLAYDQARAEVDTIFGPKFHPSFPREIVSSYPSTLEGQYNEGIDLAHSGEVVAPFASYVHSLELELLPVDLRPLYTAHIGSTLFVPTEPALSDIRLILPNLLLPSQQIVPTFVQSGEIISAFNAQYIHVEAFKVVEGVWFRIDPTQFLQPVLNPQVSVEFECNDVIVFVGGVVVERRSLLESTNVVMEMIGDPLVENTPGHEFPQPFDLVVRGDDIISSAVEGSNITDVTFFQSSTLVIVGPIPVQFDFTSVGSYDFSYSPSINLLSKTLRLPATPTIHAKARGSMRVIRTVTAEVEFSGTVLQASLPLTMSQDFNVWPQTASSTMDVVLAPSTLTLASQLFPRSAGGGDSADEAPLQTNTLWRYSLPAFNRSEFSHTGSLDDTTLPVFTPLAYSTDQSNCFVRQSPGRSYDNPAFELEFNVADPDSLLTTSYQVGTAVNSEDVLERTIIAGRRIIVPTQLISGTDLYFTVSAHNLNGIETFATCKLPDETIFDRSPPMARIVPIRRVSSHPSKIRVLVTLFDEAGFDGVQEVAIGRVPGEGGDSVMVWSMWNSSLINTPPEDTGNVLDFFSFARAGRLIHDILLVLPSVDNLTTCASACHGNQDCFSFDYSQRETNCILHGNIEGPSSAQNTFSLYPYQNTEVTRALYENIYSTPELRTAGGYYHYERLGAGNSTELEFSDLTFEHNMVYYINVRIRNRLGVENVVTSAGFLVDLTPPHPGMIRNASSDTVISEGCDVGVVIPGCIDESGAPNHRIIVDGPGSAAVFNGPSPALDAMFTSANTHITAHWNGIQDIESGIFAFTWCIGTSIGACDILPPTDPHAALGLVTAESWTNSGLASFTNLSDGSYYISVQAISNIDYGGPLATTVRHSVPYIIDTTPPVVEEVYNVQYNHTSNELSLEYNVTDEQSEIRAVEIAIGRTSRDTGLLGWTMLELGGRGFVTVAIPDGVPGWVKLRVTNNAGLRSIAVAEDSVMVDRTPPLVRAVYDGSEISLDDSFQSSLDMLCVNWEGVSDPESGIAEIEWNISLTSSYGPGFASRVLSSSEIARHVACMTGLSLNHNTTYYSFLSVTNGAMAPLTTIVGSDGVRTDMTPPSSGYVSDGPDPTINQNFSSSQTTLSATWAGVQDYESGIERYRVTIYRQPLGSSAHSAIYEESISGNINEISWSYFGFSGGDFVTVEVEGFNGAGLSSVQTSDGVIIDLTPPDLMYIVDGLNPPNDESFQSNSSTFQVSWSVTDDESGISQITGTIFELMGSFRVQVYPDPYLSGEPSKLISPTDNTWMVSGLELNAGSRYIASLSFTNEAGLRSVFETNGITIDLSPPVVEYVSITSDTYTSSESVSTVERISNRVNVRWSGLDPESGIENYIVGIVNENLTFVTTPNVTFDGSSVGGSIDNLELTPGEEVYQVAVVAVNNVGLLSDPVYSSQFRVVNGDSAGVVIDGDSPDLTDIDYTDEVTTVTARFYGFDSQVCGGISRYEWAVGTADDNGGVAKESVMAFTAEGVITSSVPGSGYAQKPIPNLSSLTGQRLYITVRGTSDCGDILESASDGFVIVTSPPSLRVYGIGPDATEHAQSSGQSVYQSTSGFSVRWDVAEEISDIGEQFFVKLGSYPGGEDINEETEVTENYFHGDISSADGTPVFVTVTALNEAGLESVAISNTMIKDTTPPVIEIASSSVQFYPSSAQRLSADPSLPTSGVLLVELSRLLDPESDIVQVLLSIGASRDNHSILQPTVVKLRTDGTSLATPVVIFEPSTVYFNLVPTNLAGLVSTELSFIRDIGEPLTLDAEVTVYGNSNSSDGPSAKCLCVTDTVEVGVALFPPDSCTGYQLGIGTRPGIDDTVHSFKKFSDLQEMLVLYNINFLQYLRDTVYFTFVCTDEHGRRASKSSGPIFIKECPSDSVRVLDGNTTNQDANSSQSSTEVHGQAIFDINCPIESVSWRVESVDGSVMVTPEIEVSVSVPDAAVSFDNHIYLYTDGVVLSRDMDYRIVVRAHDVCNQLHEARSDGFCYDDNSFTGGIVMDGCVEDHESIFQSSTSTLCARWSGFGEGCNLEPLTYSVAVGSDPRFPSTRTDVVPLTDVGLNTSLTFEDLDLVSMSTYYITVRAFTESGRFVDVTSNGVTVGFEQAIVPGEITLNPYQSDTSDIVFHWSDFHSEVPVRRHEVAVGTTRFSSDNLELFCQDLDSDFAGEFSLFGFVSVNLDTSASFNDLNLTHNTTYYPVLRVLDQADKCLTITAERGVTIDTTPPLFETRADFVQIGTEVSRSLNVPPTVAVYVAGSDSIRVSWNRFYDEESEISSYDAAIYTQSVCGDSGSVMDSVADFKDVGDERETSFEGVALEEDVAYVAVIRGWNRAGLTSRAYSLPFVVDSLEFFSGDVKDGSSWENDVTFQSDLSMLSAAFAHTKLPPPTPSAAMSGPCPNSLFYTLSTYDSSWSGINTVNPLHPFSTGLIYSSSQVNISSNGVPGIAITARRSGHPANTELLTGGYRTGASLAYSGTVSVDILPARGEIELERNTVTSVLFVDGGEDDTVAVFEPEADFMFPDSANFSVLGLQLYRGNATSPPNALLWGRSGDPGSVPVYVSHDLSHIDLSQVHTFSFEFEYERDDIGQTRSVVLYIDGILEMRLYSIPVFSDNTQIVLHVFSRMGYVPPPGFGTPAVQAVFGNVSLPMRMGGACDYGNPFFSRGSPVVEFRAAVGSTPGSDDVAEYMTVSTPCLTCLPTTPCPSFGCDPNCTLEDPAIIPVVFTNLTLSPGNDPRERNQSETTVDPSSPTTLSSILIGQFQPATYFITVEAITASGGRFRETSNGVTIDTTPPNLVSEIEQFDVTFSLQEPSRFQGNNHTIASRWLFEDLQSGIIKYEWAIGTVPYGQDVQPLTSVGMETSVINSNLSGVLQENTTYYVSVVATNGAGLSSNATSGGITYSNAELNITELIDFVTPDHTDVVLTLDDGFGNFTDILRLAEANRVGISWTGVGDDVEEIYWSIGSESSAPRNIFPRTLVSFNSSQSAMLSGGVLLLDDRPFANISEVVAVAEGKAVDPRDNEFYFEPGRLFYQSLELCNFVHRCTIVNTDPSVLIRDEDMTATAATLKERVVVTVTQEASRGSLPSNLDRSYVYTLSTYGLEPNSLLITGYLSHSDVTQNYPVEVPYISDPFLTMAQTSREIARRFTEVGGPSFFISFLGQEDLSDMIEVNVTFDGRLDWSAAVPELAYWDIDAGLWREVGATCLTESTVDWPTLTISVQVCSTLLDLVDSADRPASLTRRRRQASGMGSGVGSGVNPDPTFAPLNYLDRPTQFIVIRVGNTSTNTPPSLNLPIDPLIVAENEPRQFQLEYEDAEDDIVSFYLASSPRLGSATLTTGGLLTFTPCQNCIGMDMIDIYIIENPLLDTQVALSATGRLLVQVMNSNTAPEVYFYGNISSNQLTVNPTISVYIDANRTSPVIVSSIAAFDFDGYHDDLSISLLSGQYGAAGSEIWLDVVNVPESLPISFSGGSNPTVTSYSDYVTFVGAYITYLPNDPNFVGTDTISVLIQDASRISSNRLTVEVEVLPSLCQNNGVCGGSLADPLCADIETRRSGFEGYNCSCPPGFGGLYCENQTSTPSPEPTRDCPVGVPMVHCDGDPCEGAQCPSHPDAVCTPNYCGACTAQWALPNGTSVTCHADIIGVCDSPDIPNNVFPSDCVSTTCDCPFSQYECPEDSIITVTRVNGCCLSYDCVCPNTSCPFLMEKALGIQPVPIYRGNKFPGRCCPSYDYLDINECLEDSQNMCTDVCTNEDQTYSCSCPPDKTLAKNGVTCGVCPYNGMEYLIGDRVKIGCNWCVCRGDDLSGERWHCTAAPCERGCFSNGQFYPVNAAISQDQLVCNCEATDISAEWSCSTTA